MHAVHTKKNIVLLPLNKRTPRISTLLFYFGFIQYDECMCVRVTLKSTHNKHPCAVLCGAICVCVCVCGWRWRHYGAVGTPALWHAALSSRDEGCKCEHCRCRCTSHQHAHIIIMMAACFVAKRVALQFKCVYKWNARLVRVVRVR